MSHVYFRKHCNGTLHLGNVKDSHTSDNKRCIFKRMACSEFKPKYVLKALMQQSKVERSTSGPVQSVLFRCCLSVLVSTESASEDGYLIDYLV